MDKKQKLLDLIDKAGKGSIEAAEEIAVGYYKGDFGDKNPAKAKKVLGWNPQKTSYEDLVRIMAEHDRKLAKKERTIKDTE